MELSLFESDQPKMFQNSLEPFRELIAYEALWNRPAISFKKLAELFRRFPGKLPSELISNEEQSLIRTDLTMLIKAGTIGKPGILFSKTFDYPVRLRDAREPIEMLYYKGNLGLLSSRSVSVVGTRKPSVDGISRTRKLVEYLVQDGFTIVSGLAEGIDTVAHRTAIEKGGQTIAVIGTPLNVSYPLKNTLLQEKIAKEYLLLSQVPYYRYNKQTYFGNRLFFPERNKTMSALSEATIIIEASDTSGTLIQARAAIEQNRKLFILDSCFKNSSIKWPTKYESLGAVRVRDYEDIKKNLPSISSVN